MRKFGEGTFGQVLECWDRLRRDYVAVKVIRNIQARRRGRQLWWRQPPALVLGVVVHC